MVTYFKTLNTGNISSGNYKEKDWTPDTDIIIKKMLITERSDYSLSNVQAYITIADKPYTKDFVPASVIGSDTEYCWKPNLKVSKGAKIYVKLVNSRTETINCDIVFEYETA